MHPFNDHVTTHSDNDPLSPWIVAAPEARSTAGAAFRLEIRISRPWRNFPTCVMPTRVTSRPSKLAAAAPARP